MLCSCASAPLGSRRFLCYIRKGYHKFINRVCISRYKEHQHPSAEYCGAFFFIVLDLTFSFREPFGDGSQRCALIPDGNLTMSARARCAKQLHRAIHRCNSLYRSSKSCDGKQLPANPYEPRDDRRMISGTYYVHLASVVQMGTLSLCTR